MGRVHPEPGDTASAVPSWGLCELPGLPCSHLHPLDREVCVCVCMHSHTRICFGIYCIHRDAWGWLGATVRSSLSCRLKGVGLFTGPRRAPSGGLCQASSTLYSGLPKGSVVKHPPANAGSAGLIPGSGRSPGGGHGSPLQDSCLENPMDREAWRATGHGVTESQTRLSDLAHRHSVW